MGAIPDTSIGDSSATINYDDETLAITSIDFVIGNSPIKMRIRDTDTQESWTHDPGLNVTVNVEVPAGFNMAMVDGELSPGNLVISANEP